MRSRKHRPLVAESQPFQLMGLYGAGLPEDGQVVKVTVTTRDGIRVGPYEAMFRGTVDADGSFSGELVAVEGPTNSRGGGGDA